ncbi:Unannotated [Lentimonas sp. CC4]|nr:Unannotated [Lentimonas sp. CC4]CAA6684950.1 Unannotated [Lentimonas sp. CC6]CAA7077937.1 Unannotated [Lentimonas sp. CC4]CAA7169859.1 Unannotated [Lentimonas sp. CC21]CAA7181485.1 Unannotated [Lentimonas sp. CC8]
MNTICYLLLLVLPGLLFAMSELQFDRSARPEKLVLGDQEVMLPGASGAFTLRDAAGKEVALSQIETKGNAIKVSAPSGSPSFTFQIEPYPNHLAIHLLNAQGIGNGHDYSLSLSLNTTDVAAYTLNDYMTTNAGDRRRNDTQLNWPYLWAWPRPNGTHGSVVLYDGTLEGSARDAVLAEIWSVQSNAGHMVRPAGQPRWSEADVLAWVQRWVEKFETMVNVCLAPESEEELYEMTERLVIPLGASRVYMFSTHWRGEYHIFDMTNESVQGKAFPEGKASLLKYSNYLAKHGAHLQLKSLVPHLGRNNERYFSESHCETRFLSWGSGKLIEDIDTSATTILFQPGPDYVWEQEKGFVRIGIEIVHTETITIDASSGVWTLSGCERGYAGTSPHAHKAGDEIVGVLDSYSFFHHADDFGQPNSLAEEILNPYGDFLNEMNVGHLHFDGTGHKKEAPWYLRNYTDYLYSRVDQPVTGSVVGGAMKANFEREFSIAEQARKATGYWGIRIGPRLHNMGRGAEKAQRNFAPNMLDMHFDIADRILLGGRRPNFTGGRSGGILTMNILEEYGFMDEALALYKDWVVLAPVYDDADVEYIKTQMKKRRGSSHYEGEDTLVLSQNVAGDYIYTPHRVMGRTSGEDPLIHIDQEWGSVPRYQQIKAGTTMELLNPYDAQEPQVVIRIEESSEALQDPLVRLNDGGGLAVTGVVQPGEYMKFEGGDSVKVYDSNWNLKHTLPANAQSFIFKKGNNTVTVSGGSGAATTDLKTQFITRGPVYVLETNKHLTGNPRRSEGISYQAEAMQLKGYQVGESSSAEGGQCIATTGSGIASQEFTGEAGVYTIAVYYFDESDGQSSYALRVDGQTHDSWIANSLQGTTRIDAASLAIREIQGVSLKPGALIEIGSIANGSEYGAIDQIIIFKQ